MKSWWAGVGTKRLPGTITRAIDSGCRITSPPSSALYSEIRAGSCPIAWKSCSR